VPAPPTFLGVYEHSLDDKGRLAIPARYRPSLDDGLVITRGLEPCLVIWDTDSWRAISERVRAFNLWQGDARRMQRLFFSGASPAWHNERTQAERDGAELAEHLSRAER
jgi:MraZ protein